jgi:hypothetical protein
MADGAQLYPEAWTDELVHRAQPHRTLIGRPSNSRSHQVSVGPCYWSSGERAVAIGRQVNEALPLVVR